MADTDPQGTEVRLNRLLNLILETAVDALGFDAASISARHPPGAAATIAVTDQRMMELDDAQYESREGPCMQALTAPGPLYLEDAGQPDERWQHFARTAAELGVRSSLSLHIPTDVGEVSASLNLYSRRLMALGEQEIQRAVRFAEQLAATVSSIEAYKAASRLARELAEAMQSRAVIEQAKGMLMADRRISADEAFEQLVALSQHANMKLRDVASRLVAERATPDTP